LAIFQLILSKFRVYILTKNVLGLLVIDDIQKRVDKRKATLLEHFAKKQKTDWHFSMVWTTDTFENSVQRNCVDNMTLNSLELRTELLHVFN